MKALTRTASDARSRARVFGTAFVAVAMVLMMVAPASGATTVNLHSPHVGASSLTFNNETDDGGLTAAVVWHFVLNGLDRGTPAAELTVTFAGAGTSVVTARVVGQGQTQHFYVGTPGHDVLTGAFAVVDSEGTGNLVLSHVSYDEVEPPVDEPPVDEPPVDEPPADEPPVEEEFLPFTEQPEAEADPYLPYTGFDSMSLLAAAGLAMLGGAGLRVAAWRRDR